jgi:hypothetical protein
MKDFRFFGAGMDYMAYYFLFIFLVFSELTYPIKRLRSTNYYDYYKVQKRDLPSLRINALMETKAY